MSEPTILPSHSRVLRSRPGRSERRRGPRQTVAYLRCWSPTPGTILNASREGVGIESFRPFRRGESVFLTSNLAGSTRRIPGHVRWCRQIATAGGSNLPVFHVGVALVQPLEERWLAALTEPRRTASPRRRIDGARPFGES